MHDLAISSRRYLGSKTACLDWLEGAIRKRAWTIRTFWDPFGGTGVVGARFNGPETAILAGDILQCNVVWMRAFLQAGCIDRQANGHNRRYNSIEDLLVELQEVADEGATVRSYWSQFGGTYWDQETANRIGAVRRTIHQWVNVDCIPRQSEDVLLASLLHAADRLAWTCGHYDAFRPGAPSPAAPLRLDRPAYDYAANRGNSIMWLDAMSQALSADKVDVCYLDPPYNSRQYGDAYHALENLVRWDRLDVRGKALKAPHLQAETRSGWCGKGARQALDELVGAIRARWIFLSYSNMGQRGHSRSNGRLSEAEILEALGRRGPIEILEAPHRPFSAGRSDLPGHAERLYCCEVMR